MTNLDQIVKNILLQKGYPLHFYLQCLTYAANCLRTLAMDDLHIVNTIESEVDEHGRACLPKDYIDYCKIGVRQGQFIKPLVLNSDYNNLIEREPPQNPGTLVEPRLRYSELFPYWLSVNYNDYGENTGRMFGLQQPLSDTFKIIPEKRQVQLNKHLCRSKIVIEYISNCGYVNAATCITEYAFETIGAYINWQLKENNRNYNLGERQVAKDEYYQQRKILRSRLNPLGKAELIRIINNSRTASVK